MAARKKQSRKKRTPKPTNEQEMMKQNVTEAEDAEYEEAEDGMFPDVTAKPEVRLVTRAAFQSASMDAREEMQLDEEEGLVKFVETREPQGGGLHTTLSPDEFHDQQVKYLTSKLLLAKSLSRRVLSDVSASLSILEAYKGEDPDMIEDDAQVVPTFLYLLFKIKCLVEDATILRELVDTTSQVMSFISDRKNSSQEDGVE